MATKKSAKKTYNITGTITDLQVGVNVQAESFEETLEKGKELTFKDFVETKGDCFDYNGPVITAIWVN